MSKVLRNSCTDPYLLLIMLGAQLLYGSVCILLFNCDGCSREVAGSRPGPRSPAGSDCGRPRWARVSPRYVPPSQLDRDVDTILRQSAPTQPCSKYLAK